MPAATAVDAIRLPEPAAKGASRSQRSAQAESSAAKAAWVERMRRTGISSGGKCTPDSARIRTGKEGAGSDDANAGWAQASRTDKRVRDPTQTRDPASARSGAHRDRIGKSRSDGNGK